MAHSKQWKQQSIMYFIGMKDSLFHVKIPKSTNKDLLVF
jgi:hypothetical protein